MRNAKPFHLIEGRRVCVLGTPVSFATSAKPIELGLPSGKGAYFCHRMAPHIKCVQIPIRGGGIVRPVEKHGKHLIRELKKA